MPFLQFIYIRVACVGTLAAPQSVWYGPPLNGRHTFVLVPKDQPSFLEVVGRHFDRHAIASQRFDSVLLHFSAGVRNDLMARVKPNAIACIRQDFSDEAVELQEFLFRHPYPFVPALCGRGATAPLSRPNLSALVGL